MARKKAVRGSQSELVREVQPPLCPPLKGVGFLPYQRGEHGGPHSHWVAIRKHPSHGLCVAGPFHDRAAAAEFIYDEWSGGSLDTTWIEHMYVPREHRDYDDE